MQPLTAGEIARATGGRLAPQETGAGAGEADGAWGRLATGVTIDHRTAQPGDLFVARRGEVHDGHAFVTGAKSQGAVGALVEAGWAETDAAQAVVSRHGPGAFYLIGVPDTEAALRDLAAWYRRRFDVPVVGVTGSNGKTTTKDLVKSILRRVGPVLATPKSFNTEVSLPLTVLGLELQHRFAVLEMAMRALGNIAQLCRIARPDVGVVTNVGPVHLEHIGSLENIARGKQELVEALPGDGTAVLNADDGPVRAMAAACRGRVIFYAVQGHPGEAASAEGPNADLRAEEVRGAGGEAWTFTLVWRGERRPVRLPLPGRHNVHNALAAAGAALACGAPLDAVVAGLAEPELTGMRLEIKQTAQGVTVIDDSYNASPASVRSALNTLAEVAAARRSRRRAAVLGDMRELGTMSDEAHRAVGHAAAAVGLDRLVAVGELGRMIALAARSAGLPAERIATCANGDEAADTIVGWVRPGDVVLVKASRGMKLERVVAALLAAGKESPV